MTIPADSTWEAPGPGSWVCDRSHAPLGPTPLYRRIISVHTAPTYRQVFEDAGAAVGTIDMQFVNGSLYRRLVPLIGADSDKGKVPPNSVLWLACRLHPELRRREKTATKVMAEKIFLDDIEQWTTTERFEWIEINGQLQAIDPSVLDDGALAAHLRRLDERLVEGWHRHHQLHANDLGPIGDLLAHSKDWGLDLTEVMELLKGASPATAEAGRFGQVVAEALTEAGIDAGSVSSMDELRAVPAAAAALDEYLDLFGWRLISDYDIEGLTLHELPAAVCAIVRRAAGADDEPDEVDPAVRAAIRERAGNPQLFDDLLADARAAYGVRDDNGPLTWAWPAGLTRRAYLEAGKRLLVGGRLNNSDHVFELDIAELAPVLEGSDAPTAEELAERADYRSWERGQSGPDLLGPPPADPDLRPLPPGLRRLMGVTLAAVTLLEPDVDRPEIPLTGLGIGSDPYRGVARVAHDAGEAIADMQPGDILVAAWTAPSFNAVFAIAGGVVIQEGGLLCHAAVMARELGIPAVIGCSEAMTEIASGDEIEVDPEAGTVKILNRV